LLRFLKLAKKLQLISFILLLVGCASLQSQDSSSEDESYCERRPVVCLLIGALIVGGAVALDSDGDSSNTASSGDSSGGNVGNASDPRLKTDMQFIETLQNGIKLYSFRYKGDKRYFVGVNAAEIHADPRHRHAIVDLGNGILGVQSNDYRYRHMLVLL